MGFDEEVVVVVVVEVTVEEEEEEEGAIEEREGKEGTKGLAEVLTPVVLEIGAVEEGTKTWAEGLKETFATGEVEVGKNTPDTGEAELLTT